MIWGFLQIKKELSRVFIYRDSFHSWLFFISILNNRFHTNHWEFIQRREKKKKTHQLNHRWSNSKTEKFRWNVVGEREKDDNTKCLSVGLTNAGIVERWCDCAIWHKNKAIKKSTQHLWKINSAPSNTVCRIKSRQNMHNDRVHSAHSTQHSTALKPNK